MSYLSFYRKYRPQSFEEVVGQEHIVRTIVNAIELDRVSHAYLFCGPRGTGKTTMAKLLAKSLNCAEGPTGHPCGVCDSCRSVASGTSVDVVEIDAASNRGINEIRELREKIRFAPSVSRVKVYIIDEVHMLTPEAFNALLKTLEEPPSHAMFVLATTEPNKIPETIQSRCQRFDFHKLSPVVIAGHLASILEREGASAEEEALRIIAMHGEGSVRDSISILEQCHSFSGDRITVDDVVSVLGITPIERICEFIDAVIDRDYARLLSLVSTLSAEGRDYRQFIQDTVSVYRDLAVLRLGPAMTDGQASTMLSRLDADLGKQIASQLELGECLYVIEKLARIETELRLSAQPSITLEVGLIELLESIDSRSDASGPQDLLTLSRRVLILEKRVTELIRRLSRGGAATVVASPDGSGVAPQGGTGAVSQMDGSEAPQRGTEAEPHDGIGAAPRDGVGALPQDGVDALPQGEAAASSQDSSHEADAITDQAHLDRVFAEILKGVRERSVPLHAVLREGKPVILRSDSLVIAFDQLHSFHMGRVSDAKNRQVIEDVASLVLGRSVRILAKPATDIEAADSVGGARGGGRPARAKTWTNSRAAKDDPNDDPLVRSVMEFFDGRIVDVHLAEKEGDRVEGEHKQANETGPEDAGSDAQSSR